MVPMPQKNGDILPWAEQASREINRFSASGVPGMLVRDGVGGVGFEQTPQNLRDRRAASAKIPGRFEISSIEIEEKEEGHEEDPMTYTVKFLNPYFDVGGKTYEVSPDESLDPPAVQIEGVHEDDIIVIKIMAAGDVDTSGELDAVSGGINGLKNRQLQMDLYTVPLYKIHGGSAVCDFRTGPIAGMGEF